jgi:hypothetical protein
MNYARTSSNFPINLDFLPPDVIPFTGNKLISELRYGSIVPFSIKINNN